MNAEKRTILERVAAGTLSPELADELLAALGDDEPVTPPPPTGDPTTLATVRVVGSFRTAKIIADPTVAEAVAEGQHTARREGDTLFIEAEDHVQPDGSGRFKFSNKGRDVNVVLGPGSKPLPLEVRMNPNLALDVTMAAGALRIQGVHGPITAQVSAGAVKIEDFEGPLNVSVAGGKVDAVGRLVSGDSTITCDAGKVRVALSKDSSVKVTGRAALGKIEIAGEADAVLGGGQKEAIIGGGAATLSVEANLGLIQVVQA